MKLLSDELDKAIRRSLLNNKVPPADQRAIVKWAECVYLSFGLLENVREGRLQIVGINEQGEPMFRNAHPTSESRDG